MFHKVRMFGRAGETSGLVVGEHDAALKSPVALSKHYPYWECNKMDRLQISPVYMTWEEAFRHDFDMIEGK